MNEHSKIIVENEKDVTLTDILNEADCIYKKYKAAKIHPQNTEAIDKFHSDITKEHKEFNTAYPTVLRHMIQEGRYHSNAFKKYLKRVESKPWLNDEQRMDSYADYFILWYKETHSKYDTKYVQELRKDYRKRLQEEHDKIEKLAKEFAEEIAKKEEQYAVERKEEAIKAFKKIAKNILSPDNINTYVEKFNSDAISFEHISEINGRLLGISEVV